MQKMLLALGFVFLVYVMEKQGCRGNVCYPQKDDFDAMCSSTYSGKTIGPRCYFQNGPEDLHGDWSDAWAYCRSRGAVLAQFHTAREVETIRNVILLAVSNGRTLALGRALIAMRDENGYTGTGCVGGGTMKWYEDEVTTSPLLIANTYVGKYHACHDGGFEVTGPRCYTLNWEDGVCGGGGYWLAPICQITNSFQNFTKTNSCMLETPGERVSAQIGQSSDCANLCSQRIWCRSYNFVIESPNRYQCELFSRSVDDCAINMAECPNKTSPENSTCLHYNNY